MKFPLRLSLDLLRSRVPRVFRGGADGGAIAHLSAAAFSAAAGVEKGAEFDAGRNFGPIPVAVPAIAAPIVWIGGEDPLQHSIVGRLSSELNQKSRNVFVHTNGIRLRQHIHEFRPDERLFFTIELAGRESLHDQIAGQSGAFARAMEGIRAAKLSGFHVCAHVTVNGASDVCETGELFEFLDGYGVDGYIASSGGVVRGEVAGREAAAKLEEIRPLVRCSRWEYFSTLLESSYAAAGEKAVGVALPGSDSGACEESA